MPRKRSVLISLIAALCLASSISLAQSGKQKSAASQNNRSGVVIAEILGYEYNNQTNTFSKNVVSATDSSDIQGSGNQTLVVVKLRRVPGVEYQYVARKLSVIASYEERGKTKEVFDKVELTVPYVDEIFFVPLIIQKGATQTTIKADLYEDGTLISTKKQLLLAWAGD